MFSYLMHENAEIGVLDKVSKKKLLIEVFHQNV